MGLDSKTIETLSVNAVRNSVVMSDYLDQFIQDNDREPSWDGFIYIYEKKPKKKENLKGRMPVQIKGRECNDFSKSEISFPMITADLRNYLYDGGCVLFVVYIGNSGLTNKIYYAELTPIKLRRLLSDARGHKTIHLKEFPTDNNKKATILLNCLQNCQKQASFKEKRLLTLEELQELGVLEGIMIPFAGVGVTDPEMAILKNEIYLYANIKGSSIPQPLEFMPESIQIEEIREANISIGNRLFYSDYRIIKSAKEVTFCIGKSFKTVFTDVGKPRSVTYKNSSRVRVLAKDLDFMLSYMDAGSFKINGSEIPLGTKGINTSNFQIEEQRENLKLAKKIVRALDLLRCEDDLDIDELSSEDWRNLQRLATAIVDKKPIRGLKEDLPPVMLMKVGKLKFAIYLERCEYEGVPTYRILDYFKTECSMAFDSGDGKMLPISQFAIFHSTEMLSISNMDYDVLLPSFQNVEHHDHTIGRANWFLLDLLSAYDIAEGKRKEKLLDTALKFSAWIMEAGDEEIDYPIKLLNHLQTIKRKREFSTDETMKLYELVENEKTCEQYKVGAYLLLDQQQAAGIHFSRLNEQEKEKYMSYPIYHFWKKSDK